MIVETLVGECPFPGQTPHEVLTTLLHNENHLLGSSIEIRALTKGVLSFPGNGI
jgi:hypothetical protein